MKVEGIAVCSLGAYCRMLLEHSAIRLTCIKGYQS